LREKKNDDRGKDDAVIVEGELKPNKTTANTLGPLPNWSLYKVREKIELSSRFYKLLPMYKDDDVAFGSR
jgi:hypothetical protein